MILNFSDDDCPFLAGAVAYQIFFALIPLLALLVGVLAFVYGQDRAESDLVEILRDVYPSATSQETRIAHELVHVTISNHSPAYWRMLGRVMPDYEHWRTRLARVET